MTQIVLQKPVLADLKQPSIFGVQIHFIPELNFLFYKFIL